MKGPLKQATRNDIVTMLVKLLKDPDEEWSFGECLAVNEKHGIAIWVRNFPVLSTNTHPVPMGIGLIAKWKIWRAVKSARLNYWMRRLDRERWLGTRPNQK